ncbi:MAG: hypothetical protein COA79_09200 [Planctomycetota bacterium]|nr:MAG: hypothetical protein COA79_09200 [Planctomycetota bacterium]
MAPSLLQQALNLIDRIDRTHVNFKQIDFEADQENLFKEISKAIRKSIVAIKINSIDNKVNSNIRIYRENETPDELINRCTDGYWKSVGREFYFPEGLDYTVSPDNSLNSPGQIFGEWTWQVNRHPEWSIAAQLYHQTQDEKYAKTVATWLGNWIEQCPAPKEDNGGSQGPWRTIEIGIRMGLIWPQVISAFKDSPNFDDTLLLAWLNSYAEQSEFVWKYKKANNWLLMEMNGLLHAGVQLPFLKQASEWKEKALNEFIQQIKTQFQPDGFQRELSTHYMAVCMTNYLKPVDLLKSVGDKVPEALLEILSRMFNSWRKLARTNGMAFGFQDGPDGDLSQQLKNLPEELLIEADNWFIDGTGNPPAQKNSFLENSGYVVLRSGWGENDLCLAFDGGPFGDGHQHEDKLSIQLFACGKTLIGEAGTVDYSDTPQRHYSLQTPAHSTAIVDGEWQNRKKNYKRGVRPLDALAETICNLDDPQPSASAIYSEGYGPDLDVSVIHKRTVKLIDQKNVEITDEFSSEDESEHLVEILFHIQMDEAVVIQNGAKGKNKDGLTMNIQAYPTNVKIYPSIIVGGEKPDLRGWAAPDIYTKGYWDVVPRPCLTLTTKFKNKFELKTKIQVFPIKE